MPSVGAHRRYYVFGSFVLDSAKRILYRDGEPLPLPGRTLETLLVLIRHRDRELQKDELFELIWQGRVVEEGNLPRQISTLRKALHETPDEHGYIVTLAGGGYRFVGQVEERDELTASEPEVSAAQETPPLAAPDHPRFRSSRAWAFASMVLMVGTVLFGLRADLLTRRAGPRSNGVSSPPRTIRQLTFGSGVQQQPAWSPDGRRIAYSGDGAGNLDIWIQSMDGGEPKRVTDSPAQDSEPSWSPDGRYIVFRSERDGGGLYVVAATGGTPQRIAPFGHDPVWGPRGDWILFSRSPWQLDFYVVAQDGKPPRRILETAAGGLASGFAVWHPDGVRITVWMGTGRDLRLATVRLDTGAVAYSDVDPAVKRRIRQNALEFVDADTQPLPFHWAPTGDALYLEGMSQGVRNLWRIAVDPSTLRWIGGPDRLTTDTGANADLTLDPRGQRIAYAAVSERVRLWSVPIDSSRGQVAGPGNPVTADDVDALYADVSADGRMLLYTVERAGSLELRRREFSTHEDAALVTGDGVQRWHPRFARDNRTVVYTKSGARPLDKIMSIGAVGAPEVPLSPVADSLDLLFDWTPDGVWAVGSRLQENGKAAIVLARTEPGSREARVLASDKHADLYPERVSPNGNWIAYEAVRAGSNVTVGVLPIQGGTPIPITSGEFSGTRPRWSPDGRLIYFLSNSGGFYNVWARRFDPGRGVPLSTSFQVTSFDSVRRVIPSRIRQVGWALRNDELVVPVADVSSHIWILDGIGH